MRHTQTAQPAAPGAIETNTWFVPDIAGPGVNDPSSVAYTYLSTVDKVSNCGASVQTSWLKGVTSGLRQFEAFARSAVQEPSANSHFPGEEQSVAPNSAHREDNHCVDKPEHSAVKL